MKTSNRLLVLSMIGSIALFGTSSVAAEKAPIFNATERPDYVPENSCYLKFKNERNGMRLASGAFGFASILGLLNPLIIFGTVPASVGTGVVSVQYDNMTELTDEAYLGRGSLLDALVRDVQASKPELSYDQIRDMYLKADADGIFCKRQNVQTFYYAVDILAGRMEIPNSPAVSANDVKNDETISTTSQKTDSAANSSGRSAW